MMKQIWNILDGVHHIRFIVKITHFIKTHIVPTVTCGRDTVMGLVRGFQTNKSEYCNDPKHKTTQT